jgi:hypothetical protein
MMPRFFAGFAAFFLTAFRAGFLAAFFALTGRRAGFAPLRFATLRFTAFFFAAFFFAGFFLAFLAMLASSSARLRADSSHNHADHIL